MKSYKNVNKQIKLKTKWKNMEKTNRGVIKK